MIYFNRFMRCFIAGTLLTAFVFASMHTAQAQFPKFKHRYGNSEDQEFFSMDQTRDGGFINAGYSEVEGDKEIYLVKTDSCGDLLWDKTYGRPNVDDIAYDIKETYDGGFIVTGESKDSVQACSNAWAKSLFLMKTNGSGVVQWTKIFAGDTNSVSIGRSVYQVSDTGYIVTGHYFPQNLPSDVLVVRTDRNGNMLWHRVVGTQRGPDYGESVIEDTISQGLPNRDFVIAGATSFAIPLHTTKINAYLLKIRETSGTPSIVFSYPYGTHEEDHAFSVKLYQCGAIKGYIVTGYVGDSTLSTGRDMFLLKTNSNGLMPGSPYLFKKYYTQRYEVGYDVIQTNQQNFVVTGTTNYGGVEQAFLTKIGCDGSGTAYYQYHDSTRGYHVEEPNYRGDYLGYAVAGSRYQNMHDDGLLFKTDYNLLVSSDSCQTPESFSVTDIGYRGDEDSSYTPLCEDTIAFSLDTIDVYNTICACDTSTLKRQSENEVNLAEELLNKTEVYPNPSNGIIHYVLPIEDGNVDNLQVFDVLGKVVWQNNASQPSQPRGSINLHQLPEGVYFLIWHTSGQQHATKFVLAK